MWSGALLCVLLSLTHSTFLPSWNFNFKIPNVFSWYGSSGKSADNVVVPIQKIHKRINIPPDLATPGLIKIHGYPVETHYVITHDGYALVMHRIPFGRKSGPGDKKIPVILQHGNLQSSADWVLNEDPENCLGFILADEGYDVWLGNHRGNTYSNKHLYLNEQSNKYWNFSFTEMGKYDVPATIDYVLQVTNQPKLHHIGFSTGNTVFYIAMALFPEYNEKIRLHISLGPSVFFGNFNSPAALLAPFNKLIKVLQDVGGGYAVPPRKASFLLSKYLPVICNPKIDLLGICRSVLFLATGHSPDQIKKSQMPAIFGHLLTPSSYKMMVHGLQLIHTNRFRPYNYGRSRNLKVYGRPSPPDFDLSKVTSPVALFRGPNDYFANKEDSDTLARHLPNLVDYYVVPNEKFAHLDFSYGLDAKTLVYQHILKLLKKY